MSHLAPHSRRSLGLPLAIAAVSLAIAGLGIAALPPRGQVPIEVRDRVIADLSARTGRDAAAVTGYYRITELRSQAMVWPDSRLGCDDKAAPAPDAPVSGYWLVVQIGANTYDYRIAGERIVLCAAPLLVDSDGSE